LSKSSKNSYNFTNFQSEPARKAKLYFDKCVDAFNTTNNAGSNVRLIQEIIHGLEAVTGVKFPLANGNLTATIDPTRFAKALGYLNKVFSKALTVVFFDIKDNSYDPHLKYSPTFGYLGAMDYVSVENLLKGV
jgi:hypothetical protein